MGERQVTGLVCTNCGQRVSAKAGRCLECAETGLVELAYDLADVSRSLDLSTLARREPWMWRYKELLPLDELAELPGLQIGYTPIFGAPRLAEWTGLDGLYLKDEGRSPAGTLEDRASALASVQARQAGRKVLAVASGGAAAPSLACLGASAGQRAVVFAPDDAAEDDLALAALFGALVLRVDGPLFEAARLCAEACKKLRWFDRTPLAAPWTFEGLKTAGHEIADQLCERMPDWVAVADAAGGELVAAVARGLEEMRRAGLVQAAPRILAVEPAGRVRLGGALKGREADAGWARAAKAVKASDGAAVAVEDEAAREAALEAARRAALAVDPDGARVLAGLRQAASEGILERGQRVLALVNGRARSSAKAAPRAEVGRELAKVEQAAKQAGV
ncbi:MAG TPA: pyridoxal-phosphate dependent enzyme [Myxococcales bacterium]|jgi:threonine synthase